MPLLISVFLFVQIINMHAIQSSLVTVNDSTFSGLSPLFPRSQSSPTPKSFIRTFPSTRLPPSRHSSQLTRLNTNPAPALFSLLLILFFFLKNSPVGVMAFSPSSSSHRLSPFVSRCTCLSWDTILLFFDSACFSPSSQPVCLFLYLYIRVCVKASEDYSFVSSCQPAAITPFLFRCNYA